MSDNTLIISIGDMDDDFADVINVWESGTAATPLNRLTFESMTGILSFLTPNVIDQPEETPPNLPLSGEEQETAVSLRSSPDKGRLGGVS
ncbi:hypothetical protein RCF98_01530 [Thiothrix lacustris]|uniref:Uncharacterized protein n=1 Tax=Thiothrix lacustris TaxID=525917 RepID=A0ABY9MR26_9GAMM|nr:hypothetical protein [Thiothrix lacustris]WML91047.1 hypothetical protein RCF98_01530 [Thiothrix lacustris]